MASAVERSRVPRWGLRPMVVRSVSGKSGELVLTSREPTRDGLHDARRFLGALEFDGDDHDRLDAAARVLWEQDCGFVPVVDRAGVLVGGLPDRDLCSDCRDALRSQSLVLPGGFPIVAGARYERELRAVILAAAGCSG